MVRSRRLLSLPTLILPALLPLAFAHGHDSHASEGLSAKAPSTAFNKTDSTPQSYFAYPEHGGLMLAHIALMTLAWFFILPVGVMLSLARSRLALVVQILFVSLHAIGLLLGTVYRSQTPNLYENNVHSKIGWIITWVILVQCVTGLLRLLGALGRLHEKSDEERETYLPISAVNLAQNQFENFVEEPEQYRYSHDSGNCTASEQSRSQSLSSAAENEEDDKREALGYESANAHREYDYPEKQGLLGNAKVQRVAARITAKVSKRTTRLLDGVHKTIDLIILPFGFVTILTGAAVYGGVFRGSNVLNGLAHSIKGGIFFWYGLLTLGRWMGCFAGFGWAWNERPPFGIVNRSKAAVPSAEAVESFVIWLYGTTNVWLEHLAAWGSAWSAMDFEHVSISIMFFGGGLAGMLVESRWIRGLLNASISNYRGPQHVKDHLTPPKTYDFPMNPFPALVILLLGIMMSSHHQESEISTMVHKQWGMLFVGFALARGTTYILTYVSPPTSYLPSRPPSELISSFCLISGGLIFIASNKDTMAAMDHRGIHAMFPFTVTMGFTAFLMAWTIVLLAVKGWAVKRKQ